MYLLNLKPYTKWRLVYYLKTINVYIKRAVYIVNDIIKINFKNNHLLLNKYSNIFKVAID
jgi:hypothetical protein